MRIASVSHVVFAAIMIAIGIVGLIKGNFTTVKLRRETSSHFGETRIRIDLVLPSGPSITHLTTFVYCYFPFLPSLSSTASDRDAAPCGTAVFCFTIAPE